MHARTRIVLLLAATLSLPSIAGAVDVTLSANLPSGQPVGTTVEWTVSGTGVGPLNSRLIVRRLNPGATDQVMYDYGRRDTFDWTPLRPGSYLIRVHVRDEGDGSSQTLVQPFTIVPVPGSTQAPVVSTTRNPLVALYSAPECNPGLFLRVVFRGNYPGSRVYRTDAKRCIPGETMNFYIAGMRASTSQSMRHRLETPDGTVVQTGPRMSFTTGAIDVAVPTTNILIPAGPDTSVEDSIMVSAVLAGQGFNAVAADIDGQIVWYYKPPEAGIEFTLFRWNDGGTFFSNGGGDPADRLLVRESDLAGNTVRETNSRRVSEQMLNHGKAFVTNVHHDIRRLPNGQIVMLGATEMLLRDVQGPGLVDVIGDQVIALDENMQFVWSTNEFDILDQTRLATGGEVCISGNPGCPLLLFGDTGNDWTHSNAIGYSPADQNLIVSVRHQDWVIKVDYQNGAGSGGLIWRLGKEGDFTPLGFPPGIDPWFTHQHDANYLGTNRFIAYDNGNMNDACLADPADCESRGQAWTLDETNFTATLDTNANLGDYNFAVGSSQALSNGNYNFNDGLPGGTGVPLSRQDEVRPDGTKVYSIEFAARSYRGYRLKDLYTAPSYD